ncbi:hypothetical protein Tco_1450186 [Tanacetum coccineum]
MQRLTYLLGQTPNCVAGFSRVQEASVINGSPHLHSIGGMEEDEDTLEKLVQSIDERHSFIQELERLPGNLEAYQMREELKGLQKDDLIKAMETRKVILQFRLRIHKEVDFYKTL